jgi:hypothetical protein
MLCQLARDRIAIPTSKKPQIGCNFSDREPVFVYQNRHSGQKKTEYAKIHSASGNSPLSPPTSSTSYRPTTNPTNLSSGLDRFADKLSAAKLEPISASALPFANVTVTNVFCISHSSTGSSSYSNTYRTTQGPNFTTSHKRMHNY